MVGDGGQRWQEWQQAYRKSIGETTRRATVVFTVLFAALASMLAGQLFF